MARQIFIWEWGEGAKAIKWEMKGSTPKFGHRKGSRYEMDQKKELDGPKMEGKRGLSPMEEANKPKKYIFWMEF